MPELINAEAPIHVNAGLAHSSALQCEPSLDQAISLPPYLSSTTELICTQDQMCTY